MNKILNIKLQSHKRWLQKRHLVLLKELNRTIDKDGTMSSELLKECEWITGELLKEFEKEDEEILVKETPIRETEKEYMDRIGLDTRAIYGY